MPDDDRSGPAIPLARWADRQLRLLAHETGSSRIAALDGATLLGKATSDGTCNWSLPLTGALSNGTHTLTAKATDAAGNTSPSSAPKAIVVDTAAPAAPVVSGLTAATDTGSSSSDAITYNTTPTVVGTSEANATVQVFDGATLLGTATADGAGNWSLPLGAALAEGTHNLTAKATDASGNTSAASTAK